ncbi:hypothetical protein, partial [Tamlana crocina]
TDGNGNYAWIDQTTDTDTQLNETQVDAFVANNGYLTAEVDGSVTNEIELPTGGNDGQVLKTDGSGNYAWIDLPSGGGPVWVATVVNSDTTLTTENQIATVPGTSTVSLPASPSEGQNICIHHVNGTILDPNGKTLQANPSLNITTPTSLSGAGTIHIIYVNGKWYLL